LQDVYLVLISKRFTSYLCKNNRSPLSSAQFFITQRLEFYYIYYIFKPADFVSINIRERIIRTYYKNLL